MKLILCLALLVLSTPHWAEGKKGPSNFSNIKDNNSMMLLWQGAKKNKKVNQNRVKKAIQQKALSKKLDILGFKSPSKEFKIVSIYSSRLSDALVELSQKQVIPPFIIGNPSDVTWRKRITMTAFKKYDPTVLDSLAEAYGFVITENKYGVIVLSTKEEERISIKFSFVTAYNAVRSVLKTSDISYIISPSIVKQKKSLSLNLKDHTISEALHTIAKAFQLKITKGMGGAIIIEPKYYRKTKNKYKKHKMKSKKKALKKRALKKKQKLEKLK